MLDICCGTGDLVLALERERGAAVWGTDFCHPMLVAAREKIARERTAVALVRSRRAAPAGARRSLDLITVAFGFRNLANYEAGLREMRRVLRPGGMAAILEFSQPPNRAFAALYSFYSRRILPLIGGALSGIRDAYTYLPESVRKFPDADELADEMQSGLDSGTCGSNV